MTAAEREQLEERLEAVRCPPLPTMRAAAHDSADTQESIAHSHALARKRAAHSWRRC